MLGFDGTIGNILNVFRLFHNLPHFEYLVPILEALILMLIAQSTEYTFLFCVETYITIFLSNCIILKKNIGL